MRNALLIVSLWLICSASVAQVAQPAFVPENGFWWSPSQSGRGYAIEQQDDFLFITVYTYSNENNPNLRAPTWFSAQGSWSPPLSTNSTSVYEFDAPLNRSTQGQCLGCPFTPASTDPTQWDISLTFDSPWQGVLQVAGETIDIERFWYSPSIADATNVMLGQWKVVRDYSEANDDEFPFEADVLVFDERRTRDGKPLVEGYQATTGEAASGAFNQDDNFYVIVVEESRDLYLAYYTYGNSFGADHFNAFAERFRPGDDLTFRGYPAEGFRAANRSFVEREMSRNKSQQQLTSNDKATERVITTRSPNSRLVITKAARQQQIQTEVNRLLDQLRANRPD